MRAAAATSVVVINDSVTVVVVAVAMLLLSNARYGEIILRQIAGVVFPAVHNINMDCRTAAVSVVAGLMSILLFLL